MQVSQLHRSRSQGGFTLIEILFAIFLVTICALIVSATMPVANVSRAKASDLDKAMGLAQKQLEAIRGLGFPNLNAIQLANNGLIDNTKPVAANTYSFTNSDSANLDNPSLVLAKGSGTVKIEQLNMNLDRVTITVNWYDPKYFVAGTHMKGYAVGTLIANL